MKSKPENALSRLYDLYAGTDFPCSVHFDITKRCNLNCVHCYQAHPDVEIETRNATRILDDLARNKVLIIGISGGEPLTNPDFFDIAQAARERNFAVRITTNGTLIDDRAADRLADLGIGEAGISIYSLRGETHDLITRTLGSHEKSMNACRLLRERKIPVRILCPIISINSKDVGDIFRWATGQGFTMSVDPWIMSGEPSVKVSHTLRVEPDEAVRILQEIGMIPSPADVETPEQSCKCGAGRISAMVTPEADLKLCALMRERLGNLLESSFRDLWVESDLRREFVSRTYSQSDRCFGCDLRPFCRTCPAREEIERNNGGTEAYYSYMKRLAKGFSSVWDSRADDEIFTLMSQSSGCENS